MKHKLHTLIKESMEAVDDARRRHRFASMLLEALTLIELEDIDYATSVLDKARQELELTRKDSE